MINLNYNGEKVCTLFTSFTSSLSTCNANMNTILVSDWARHMQSWWDVSREILLELLWGMRVVWHLFSTLGGGLFKSFDECIRRVSLTLHIHVCNLHMQVMWSKTEQDKAWGMSKGWQSVLLKSLQTLVRCYSPLPRTKMAWNSDFNITVFLLHSSCLFAFASL